MVGHVSRSSGLAKAVLQGTIKGKKEGEADRKEVERQIEIRTAMDLASSTRAA